MCQVFSTGKLEDEVFIDVYSQAILTRLTRRMWCLVPVVKVMVCFIPFQDGGKVAK